jgi:toxin-antitoxin system PIN domain toxin
MTCFPDINVWIALIVAEHIHHEAAADWYRGAEWTTLIFSRITQMGFLRLLTNGHVMGKQAASARGAWTIMDQLFTNPGIRFAPDPQGIEKVWRSLTTAQSGSSLWTGAWLAAFAISTGYTLVTLDPGLSKYSGLTLKIL